MSRSIAIVQSSVCGWREKRLVDCGQGVGNALRWSDPSFDPVPIKIKVETRKVETDHVYRWMWDVGCRM